MRPPFAFPLCRDSLCNASTIVTDYTPQPNFIETTYTVIRMLKRKAYYLETQWVTKGIDGRMPEVLFIGEVKDERWLMEVLGFDWEQLLDFIADACLKFLRETRKGLESLITNPLEIVSPNGKKRWGVVGIDLDEGGLIIKDEYGRKHAYPIPSDISPYTDATVGNTRANWWAVIRGCAINFLTNYTWNEAFVDMINERIADRMGLFAHHIYLKARKMRITGNEITFYKDADKLPLSVGVVLVDVVLVGKVYFPLHVSSGYRHIFLSFLYEGFQQDTSYPFLYDTLMGSNHYLYYKSGNSIGVLGVGSIKDSKVEVSVKVYEDRVRLMLGKNAWIRLLLMMRERNRKIMPHLAIQMTKYRGEESEDFALLRRTVLPPNVLNSLLERIGSSA